MSRSIRSVLQDAPIIDPSATGSQIYDLFSENPDLLICAVIEQGFPIGLVARNTFFMTMAKRHGRDLYARRPITFVMEKNPLIVDIDEPVNTVSRLILNDHLGALFDGFIITENGQYAGIGTGAGLMKLVHEESEHRNHKLTALAEQLGRARIDAMNASKAKSDFMAMLSHEIRSPLSGVLAISDILGKSDLTEEQTRLNAGIKSSGQLLLRILNDVLDLSKIESGKFELNSVDFQPETLVTDLQTVWASQAEEKGIAFSLDHAGIPSSTLFGDHVRIKQVLGNLMSNAIKFTDRGSVKLSMRFTPHGLDQTRLHCTVEDTGCGIAPQSKRKLFQPFNQASPEIQHSHGGTGLGLAISKQLIESMGGSIGFESALGKGSKFWFTLPLSKHAPKPVSVDTEPPKPVGEPIVDEPVAEATRPRLLVAEDNLINQEVMAGFLKSKDLDFSFVGNGQEAVEAVKTQHYDLILMDLQMPVMDGIEACRRIRALGQTAAKTPILAVTAKSAHEAKALCETLGIEGFVTKPINRTDLLAQIEDVVQSSAVIDHEKAVSSTINNVA